MGSKLSTFRRRLASSNKISVPPGASPLKATDTLHKLPSTENTPPRYTAHVQPHIPPPDSNKCRCPPPRPPPEPPQRLSPPPVSPCSSPPEAPIRWEIYDLESDQQHLLEGESLVVLTSQSKDFLGRPVVVASLDCIRDVVVEADFSPGHAICMLGFYQEMRRARLRESDPAVLGRLEVYRQKILAAATAFQAKIMERMAMMITQRNPIEHWWICQTILCWDVGKVDILMSNTVFRGILHAVQVEEHLRWIQLYGVYEGDRPGTQRPFCIEFDPEFSRSSKSLFNLTPVSAEVRKE